MYLSKLELQGFKSFADRTVLQFDPGITAIVGPNGCGKSNVVDAVRWVIGEQRARVLRSDQMANVIFNGTANRRALGLSEVLLTIENTRGVLPTEYTEVTIGRRLYRSGDSEYLLNGVQCRLKDIVDLFMDTGMGAGAYSIIELKMVEEILSENTQDRRRLFEEASGITKYKLRRRQALSKLDTTQADLTRLRDLVEEIEKQVRSLKRQANKAERHKQFADRLRYLELALAQTEYERLTAQRRALHEETGTLRDRITGLTAQTDAAEADLEARRTTLVEREQTLSTHEQALSRHLEAVRSLEAEQRLAEERRGSSEREQARLRQEREAAEDRRAALEETLARLQGELDAAEPALAAAEEALEAAQAERDAALEAASAQRAALQRLRADEQRAQQQRDELRRQHDRLANRLELLEQDERRARAQAEEHDDAGDELAARLRHAEQQLGEAEAALEAAQAQLAATEQAHTDAETARAEATDALHQAQRQRDAVAAQVDVLEGLLSSYEEFSEAVQYLATTPEGLPAGLRTVADVLGCDEADRLALDAALGDEASCIVVASDAEMQAAIERLRAAEKGRATFIVLDRLHRPAPLPDAPADALRDRVRVAEPAFAPLADVLLHGCFVADTLDDAREAARAAAPPARCFARTGEWVDARGLLHGGSPQQAPSPAAGRLSRREQYDAARAEQDRLNAEVDQATAAAEAARAVLKALPLEAHRNAVRLAERARSEASATLGQVRYEHEAAARRQREVTERLDALGQELTEGRARLAKLATEVADAETRQADLQTERTTAEETFQRAEAESRAAAQAHNTAQVAAIQVRNQHDNLSRDQARTQDQLGALHARQHRQTEQLDALAEQLREAHAHDADLAEQLEAERARRFGLEEAVTTAKGALNDTKAAIADLEAQLRGLRREREQAVTDENQRAVRIAEIETRAADLLAHLEEDFEVDLRTHPVEIDEDFQEEPARAEVRELRAKLRKIGPVNELALEAYEQESERLSFMTDQLRDLEAAEHTLLETIDEINTTAANRFMETFEAVQANFQKLFKTLFGEEASARLLLVDEDDPLETTIEIEARPRGKRPSTLAQLSGGEKTLTATALLFAIYLVKPSPFCILDEVDAPLDDANVDRFMNLIQSFSEDTQFILVTHNKRTMEAADRMYGITMQEQGVSKLVGVKFGEALELAGSEA